MRPVVHPMTEALYQQMLPVAVDDEARGWPLLTYLNALTMPLHELDDLTRDRDGLPGWAVVMMATTAPVGWLPWLAQFKGKRYNLTFTEQQNRDLIRGSTGYNRGTPQSFYDVLRPFLETSSPSIEPTVLLRERYDPENPTLDKANHVTVVTLSEESPDDRIVVSGRDVSRTLRSALLEVKPVGVILHSYIVTGKDYQQTIDTGRTYGQALTQDPTYNDRSS